MMTLKKLFHVISAGRVKATIWHETKDGTTLFNVAFTKLFTDQERWWDGSYFQVTDLPAIGRLADDVRLWIAKQSRRLGSVDGFDGDGSS